MKIPWKTILPAILVGILGAVAAASWWLLATNGGASWLVRTAIRRAPVPIEVGAVSGRVVGELRLRSVEARWASGSAAVDSVRLRWRPLSLLKGTISFGHLIVEGASVTLPKEKGAPEEAPGPYREIRWPVVTGLPAALDGRIDSFRLSGLAIRLPGRAPVTVEEIACGVSWREGVLGLSGLSARSGPVRIDGALAAGFARPSFRADLAAWFPRSPSGAENLSLAADLRPAAEAGTLAGPAQVTATFPDARFVRLSADVSLGRNEVVLEDLALGMPQQPKAATGKARVTLRGGRLRVAAELELHGLDLFANAGTHTAISGTLSLSGNPGGYAGIFSLENRGKGVREISLSGEISGDLGGLTVPRVTGSWLGGRLDGNLTLAWEEGFALEGKLEGRDLDPARIDEGWRGRIRFAARGSVRKRRDSPVSARVDVRLLESTLRGRPLTGEIRAGLDREGPRIDRLELHGDGFDASAHGRLRERMDVRAEIRDLSGILPGTEGSVTAEGRLRLRDRSPEGILTVEAANLSVGNVRIRSLTASARRVEPGSPFEVTARAREASAGAARADSLSLEANGTPGDHRVRLSLDWAGGGAQGSAHGSYGAGRWEGTLDALSLREKEGGTWSLASAVPFSLSAGAVRVRGFHAIGPGGKSFRGNADLAWYPLRGTAEADWNGLDPALADPWLGGLSLTGSSSGHVRFAWPAAGSPVADFRITAAGRIRRGKRELRVENAEAEGSWGANGFSARWEIGLGDNGTLAGRVSSGRPVRLGFPEEGESRAVWRNVDLSLLSPWIPGMQLTGISTGELQASWRKNGRITLSGKGDLSGTMIRGDLRLTVRIARVEIEGDEGGTRAEITAVLDRGASVTGSFRSLLPARAGIPQGGKFRIRWQSIDLSLLAPWLPSALDLAGTTAGRAEGEILPGGKFAAEGEAHVASAALRWTTGKGEISAPVRAADLRASWDGKGIRGEFSVSLEEYGKANGTFGLPLPAEVPFAVNPQGEVVATVSATLREKGLLPSFFPGMVQESSGKIDLDLRAGGTWASPEFGGTFSLAEAGAYVPAAGIRLRDLEAKGTVSGREIRIESLTVRSGEGSLAGTGEILLARWDLSGYKATLKGENFQAADLPEFRLSVSPDLRIEGTKERLQVRGEIAVPYLLIYGRQAPPPVRRSEDVVIVDAGGAAEKGPPLTLDIEGKVVLGKHVLVKAEGIDARLEGGLTLRTDRRNDFTAQGEIRVAEGEYSTYGVRLRIARGRLLFAGGPVERPTLDILATRKVGDVTAGVQVTGTPRRPDVKLYSEPPMPDTDVLSYIVLGHPLGEERGEGDALMLAANALLPMTQSAVLQDRIERRFGIDVLDVKTGEGKETGTAITVGKYLNPRLFVSYGRSLFTGTNEVTVRYDFLKRWQIESQIGEESGIDLFYKIEFR